MPAITTATTPANLLKIGRILFIVGIICIGVQQIANHSLSQVIVPDWPAYFQKVAWAYILGIVITVLAVLMLFSNMAVGAAVKLGILFLLLFVLVQAVNQLFIVPYGFMLGAWTNPLKELTLSGGAFLVAASYMGGGMNATWRTRLILAGRIFFAITMIAFGIDHFLYTDFVATLVPVWIPGHLFWTYLAGVALIGLGLALLIGIFARIAGLLLGAILLIWVIVLHIPRAIANPYGDKGNELTSVFQAVAFAGIAIMLSCYFKKKK